MSFIEKIKTGITGKTAEQRANDRLAQSMASRQIQKAAFEERSRQMTRVAVEKEKLRADAMLRKEKARYAHGGGMFGGIAASFKGTSLPVGNHGMSKGLSTMGSAQKQAFGSYHPIWGSRPSSYNSPISRTKVVKRKGKGKTRIIYKTKYVSQPEQSFKII